MSKPQYPNDLSDLSDLQWAVIEAEFGPVAVMRRPLAHDRRQIVNAILYQSRTGCQWRYLPNEFPPRPTIHGWFVRWRKDGTWDRVHDKLTRQGLRPKRPLHTALVESHCSVGG